MTIKSHFDRLAKTFFNFQLLEKSRKKVLFLGDFLPQKSPKITNSLTAVTNFFATFLQKIAKIPLQRRFFENHLSPKSVNPFLKRRCRVKGFYLQIPEFAGRRFECAFPAKNEKTDKKPLPCNVNCNLRKTTLAEFRKNR